MARTSSKMDQLSDLLRESKIDHVLLTSLESLRYFGGHTTAIETGPSPFSPLPGALAWIKGEEPILFLADSESSEDVGSGITCRSFPGYTYQSPLSALEELANLVASKFANLLQSTVAVEMGDLPAFIFEKLSSGCPQLEFQDVTTRLIEMRSIKDDDEVEAIRSALALCDLGQARVKQLVAPGLTELEVFNEMRKTIESKAGGRVPLLADLVSGSRTAAVGGNPDSSKLQKGDLVIADLVPRYNGYWGDTCNTCAVEGASAEQQRLFQGVKTALEDAIDQVKPGLRACELDSHLRQRIAKLGGAYPHHSGHGLGVTFHEEPRIVPYNQTMLRAGMVIALEPGIYIEGKWGLRLEHSILVTEAGAEVLSKFEHTL